MPYTHTPFSARSHKRIGMRTDLPGKGLPPEARWRRQQCQPQIRQGWLRMGQGSFWTTAAGGTDDNCHHQYLHPPQTLQSCCLLPTSSTWCIHMAEGYFHAYCKVMHMFIRYSINLINNIGMHLVYSQNKFMLPFTHGYCFICFTPSTYSILYCLLRGSSFLTKCDLPELWTSIATIHMH